MLDIDALLRSVAENKGSDLHLKVGAPPTMRIDGSLRRMTGPPLKSGDTTELVRAILPADRKDRLDEADEVDFAYSVAGVARFRVNAFRQRGSLSVVFRLVRVGSQSFEDLGLPPVIRDLADAPRGLILVTGPTGSGKTTTLAAMIDHINNTKPAHILTIEDPIEVLHPDRMATVNQRELGVDTGNFLTAMRAAMREDPDVILIGEMRDPETVTAAMSAGETGHLVLSTLHTTNAVETVNRVVDFFPPYQQHQVRVSLAGVLRGVVCQRLVPRAHGGRIPALEIMVSNGRIADRIIDSEKTSEIHEIIRDGDYYGMQTFDQSLLRLVQEGAVTVGDAMIAASEPHDLALMLEQIGEAIPA